MPLTAEEIWYARHGEPGTRSKEAPGKHVPKAGTHTHREARGKAGSAGAPQRARLSKPGMPPAKRKVPTAQPKAKAASEKAVAPQGVRTKITLKKAAEVVRVSTPPAGDAPTILDPTRPTPPEPISEHEGSVEEAESVDE